MPHNLHDSLQPLKDGKFYSLKQLGKALGLKIERLPLSIRIVLESVLRNCDGQKVTEAHVRQLAGDNQCFLVCQSARAPCRAA